MDTKEQKLRLLLNRSPAAVSEAPRSASQEVYRRKLAADIARTKKFIEQANNAIEQLQEKHGSCPDSYSETTGSVAGEPEASGENRGLETSKMAHLLAHYEVYKQMPYQPMKNDSIGIATALTLNSDAVSQQASASDYLQHQNEQKTEELAELKAILADYTLANVLIKERVAKHPLRMAEMQEKLDGCTSYEAEIDVKLSQVQTLSEMAKSREEKMHQNLQRVILKMHAMMDWGNAHLMDEATFKKSISSSVTFLKTLIANISDGKEEWISVLPGSVEERLAEIMVRHDVLLLRNNGVPEVKLRNYGRA
ncbi:hypothetical protein OXX79_005274 [Metschnikowia pulcherrima]